MKKKKWQYALRKGYSLMSKWQKIPLEWDTGVLVVRANVGEFTIPFVLDTQCPYTALSVDIYRSSQVIPRAGSFVRNRICVGMLGELGQILPLTLPGGVIVHPYFAIFKNLTDYGLLGADILLSHSCVIDTDPVSPYMIIRDQDATLVFPRSPARISMKIINQDIELETLCTVDTGFSSTSITSDVVSEMGLERVKLHNPIIMDATKGTYPVWYIISNMDVEVNNVEVTLKYVEIDDGFEDPMLGMAYLKTLGKIYCSLIGHGLGEEKCKEAMTEYRELNDILSRQMRYTTPKQSINAIPLRGLNQEKDVSMMDCSHKICVN